jgi:transposase
VRCLRCDVHHKTALALVRAYDTISVEAIAANVSRRPEPNPGRERQRHWGLCAQRGQPQGRPQHEHSRRRVAPLPVHSLSLLAYTAAYAGKRVEAVPPAYTSLDCSGCGKRIHTSLRVRTHACTHCGLILDRDLNAATTIFWRGKSLRGVAVMPAVGAVAGVAGVAEGRNRDPAAL